MKSQNGCSAMPCRVPMTLTHNVQDQDSKYEHLEAKFKRLKLRYHQEHRLLKLMMQQQKQEQRDAEQNIGIGRAKPTTDTLVIRIGVHMTPTLTLIKNTGRPSRDFVMSVCPRPDNSVFFVRGRSAPERYRPDGSLKPKR